MDTNATRIGTSGRRRDPRHLTRIALALGIAVALAAGVILGGARPPTVYGADPTATPITQPNGGPGGGNGNGGM
jgi:hypothetical protein